MRLLEQITELSHEFGGPEFVKGGGGNTSAKTAETLWVKPSGTTLRGLRPERFVAMDRARLAELYDAPVPVDPREREAVVKELMAAAVKPGETGRPSVEAPLHDLLDGDFVVHTHAVLVNGMTCARDGQVVCERLFPEALWVPYIDPGYTLCMDVRRRLHEYAAQHGRQPSVILLDNHGIFVAGHTPQEIWMQYRSVLEALGAEYARAGVATELTVASPPSPARVREMFQILEEHLGNQAAAVVVEGRFAVPDGPISPDHIVYATSFPYIGVPTQAGLELFQHTHGYRPRVFVTEDAVYAAGATATVAELAMELAKDGALLQQLAAAFGGIEFLTDEQRGFIENWEVEAYRQKQMQ